MTLLVHPSALLGFLLRIECFGQGMQVFAGVVKIQQLVRLRPTVTQA
jgi:hypothetical protein